MNQDFEVLSNCSSECSFSVIGNSIQHGKFDIDELSFTSRQSKSINFLSQKSQGEGFSVYKSTSPKQTLLDLVSKKENSVNHLLKIWNDKKSLSKPKDANQALAKAIADEYYELAMLYDQLMCYNKIKDYLRLSNNFFKEINDREGISNNTDAIAYAKSMEGDLEGSLASCEESIEVKAELHGAQSKEVGLARFERGKLLYRLGSQTEGTAEVILAKMMLTEFEKENRETLALIGLFIVKKDIDSNDLISAEENFREIRQKIHTEFSVQSEIRIECDIVEAIIFYRTNKIKEAKRIFKTAYLIEMNRVRPNTTRIHTILKTLTKIYIRNKKAQKAISYALQAEAIITTSFSESDTRLASTYSILAEAYSAIKNYSKAIESINKAISIYIFAFGEKFHLLSNVYHEKGNILLNWNKLSESQEAYEKVLKIDQEKHGENHPNSILTLKCLGCVNIMLNQEDMGLIYLKQAFELSKAYLGNDHESTKQIKSIIGNPQILKRAKVSQTKPQISQSKVDVSNLSFGCT